MSIRRFLRIVFLLEGSSSESAALAHYTKPVVFLALTLAGLFFFGSGNPRAHVARYFLSLFFFIFFFRALFLSLIEIKPSLASSGASWTRWGFTFLPIFLFAVLFYLGLFRRDFDLLATSLVCLVAATTGWKNAKFGRLLGYFDLVLLLVSLAFFAIKADAFTFSAAILCALAAFFLITKGAEAA
jgi:hypothetical protein